MLSNLEDIKIAFFATTLLLKQLELRVQWDITGHDSITYQTFDIKNQTKTLRNNKVAILITDQL